MKVRRSKLKKQPNAAELDIKCREFVEELGAASEDEFCRRVQSLKEWPFAKVRHFCNLSSID